VSRPTTVELAKAIRPRVTRCALLEIWGAPVFRPGDVVYQVESVTALFAGLTLHLRSVAGGERRALKIAQPGPAKIEEGRLEIAEAAYVQWVSQQFRAPAETNKPALLLLGRV
jgi:hypothetical protein